MVIKKLNYGKNLISEIKRVCKECFEAALNYFRHT